jgi:hypothetical protein
MASQAVSAPSPSRGDSYHPKGAVTSVTPITETKISGHFLGPLKAYTSAAMNTSALLLRVVCGTVPYLWSRGYGGKEETWNASVESMRVSAPQSGR